MGTYAFDAGNVVETSDVRVAAKNGPPSDATKAAPPKMGCLPARCCICRDCQHVCIGRQNHAGSSGTSSSREQLHIPRRCKCVTPRRCPTPPRMLSPCDDDDSVRVPVADIWTVFSRLTATGLGNWLEKNYVFRFWKSFKTSKVQMLGFYLPCSL